MTRKRRKKGRGGGEREGEKYKSTKSEPVLYSQLLSMDNCI